MAWFNAGLSSNSGGASSFNELDDVSINTQTLSNGQVPVYNSTTHKWENGEQSGGSSGHIIIDDGGASLAQRDNLQFKGAYSEDNSANGKTVVNVVRSMTKAQFDQLTNNEKAGFINITDITGGNDDRFQPVIYSTEEREIGVWTDGKPLYERVIDLGADTNISYNSWTLTTVSLSEIDRLVLIQGLNSTGAAYYGDLYGGNNNGYLQLLTGRNGTYVYVRYLIFRYTKTTDQAGSGQWTPQGVPAHHYSTDEQVVGTWIDGSTLYERTIEYSHTTQGKQTVSLPTGVVWSNIKNIAAIVKNETDVQSTYIFDATNRFSVRANFTDGIIVTIGSSYPAVPATVTITIRYTKSSS